jgi:Tfp pilus assembly protein PilF
MKKGKLDKAIALDPKLAEAHGALGQALQAQGKLREAVRAYRRALALAPKDAKAHYNLGLALYKQGQRAEAVREFRRARRSFSSFNRIPYSARISTNATMQAACHQPCQFAHNPTISTPAKGRANRTAFRVRMDA